MGYTAMTCPCGSPTYAFEGNDDDQRGICGLPVCSPTSPLLRSGKEEEPPMKYYVQFSLPRDDAMGPRLGPFDEFVQVTYEALRSGPNGDDIAYFHRGEWFTMSDPNQGWSDVVIWAE